MDIGFLIDGEARQISEFTDLRWVTVEDSQQHSPF